MRGIARIRRLPRENIIKNKFITIYLWQRYLIYYNVFNKITIYDNIALALINQAEGATI